MTMLALRRLLLLIVVGVVLAGGAGLASGRIAHVATNGVSMQPTYFAGDLVVVAKADHYEVGDIAAYRVPKRPTLVLHRIIDGDASGFTLQGDNNRSIDPYTPRHDEIVGRAVLHVPKVGRVLSSPITRGGVLALVLVVFGVMTMKPNSSSPRTPRHAAPRSRGGRLVWKVMLAVDVVLLVAFGFAHVDARGHAAPAPLAAEEPPVMTADLSYGALVAAGDVYPTGLVGTGDPVFTRLLDRVDVTFRYGTEAPSTAVTGTAKLDVTLATAGGWRSTQPLVAEAPIEAGAAELTGTLVLPEIRALAARVAETIGGSASSIDVTVTASGSAALAGGDPVGFSVKLPMQLNGLALTMTGEPKTVVTGAGPVVRETVAFPAADAEAVASTDSRRDLRTPALIALLLAVAATAVLWPTEETAASAATRTKALKIDVPVTMPRFQVDAVDAVEAIAESSGRPVIEGEGWVGVLSGEAFYWCSTAPAAPPSAPSPAAAADKPASPKIEGHAVSGV